MWLPQKKRDSQVTFCRFAARVLEIWQRRQISRVFEIFVDFCQDIRWEYSKGFVMENKREIFQFPTLIGLIRFWKNIENFGGFQIFFLEILLKIVF